LFNQKFEISAAGGEATLRIHFPFSLSRPGLCKNIYDRVDDFYLHLDKFKNPGFGLGLDIVPGDEFIIGLKHREIFTGTFHL